MIYATVDDLLARFGERELVALTDPEENAAIDLDRVQRALGDAQALTDGYVGQVYRLPLKGCAKPALPGQAIEYAPPVLLTRVTCDIARYYLHTDLAPEHEVYRRFVHARDQLTAVAEGRAQLACPWGGSPGEPLASDAQTGQGVRYQFSQRAMTDDAVGSYA